MTYLAPVAPPVPVPSRDHAPAILAVAEALRHEANAAEDRAGHPVQITADRVQVLAELFDENIEFARKIGWRGGTSR